MGACRAVAKVRATADFVSVSAGVEGHASEKSYRVLNETVACGAAILWKQEVPTR